MRSIETLGPDLARRLLQLECDIEVGLRAYERAGTALGEIRDDGLWRGEYDTFADYCERRWEMRLSRAYQMMEAARIARLLSTNGGKPPANERQARALAPLKDDPEALTEVWSELQGEHDGHLTAVIVQKAVHLRTTQARSASEPDSEPRPARRPHRGEHRLLLGAAEPGDVEAASYDALITRAPVDADMLVAVAMHSLKVGGSVALIVEQCLLPQEMALLQNAELRQQFNYCWTLALMGEVQTKGSWNAGVGPHGWTPVLWFAKGKRLKGPWVPDVQRSLGDLITALTPPRGRVLDPLCRDGEVVAAACEVGRSAYGIDPQPEMIDTSTARLAA